MACRRRRCGHRWRKRCPACSRAAAGDDSPPETVIGNALEGSRPREPRMREKTPVSETTSSVTPGDYLGGCRGRQPSRPPEERPTWKRSDPIRRSRSGIRAGSRLRKSGPRSGDFQSPAEARGKRRSNLQNAHLAAGARQFEEKEEDKVREKQRPPKVCRAHRNGEPCKEPLVL